MMSLKWLVFFFVADDHSRVVLTGKREFPGSDYINANYVDVRVFFTILILLIPDSSSFLHWFIECWEYFESLFPLIFYDANVKTF